MKKVIEWLRNSNHWKHVVGGLVIGFCADSLYCAAYAGIGVASTLELKDRLWGGKWDWVDWSLTVAGVAAGWLLHVLIF